MGFFSRIAQWFVAPPVTRRAVRPRPGRSQYAEYGGLSLLPRKGLTPEDKKGRLPATASPPYIQTVSTWTMESALSAINEHERGNMNRSGLLWKWMLRDDRLKTVLNVRCSGLSSLPFRVLPSTEQPTPAQIEAARMLQDGWATSFPADTLRAIIRIAVGMGVVVGRISWHPGKHDLWWPRLTLWPEESIRYDDAMRCWYALTREGGEEQVTPGDGNWFLWEPDGARGWQLGAVMALALPVLITMYNWQDWINFNDAHGRPVRKVKVPRGATPNETATFLANVRALGRTTSSILCRRMIQPGDDFDFEYVTPNSQGIMDTFVKSIEAADKAKSTLILGQTLTTDASTSGNRALGDIHNQVKQQILQADGDGLAGAIRSQILTWWAKYNFGSASLAPRPQWIAALPADLAAKAATMSALAKAVMELDQAFMGTDQALNKVALLAEANIPMMARPPSQVPEVENALNFAQSEGLLGAWMEVARLAGYELDLESIFSQNGVPFKKLALLPAPTPPADDPPPVKQEQLAA